jgi:hypothetical protein
MSMDRNAMFASASTAIETHELILIVEGMHHDRGRNDSTLKKISEGAANKARKKYIVVHLPQNTAGGDSAMRKEVAAQIHQLIQHYKPHKVIFATDYNLGTSSGACTLQEFSAFLTNPDKDLNLPPILIDNQLARAKRDPIEQAFVKSQNQTRNLILVNYVLYGGDLAQLNAACEEFADGKFSHWIAWRAIMSKIMRPSTPDAKSLTAKPQAPSAALACSPPSLTAIDEQGSNAVLDMYAPAILLRTLSLPARTNSLSDSGDQPLASPSFSGSASPVSYGSGSYSPECPQPSASPAEISLDDDVAYELSHMTLTSASTSAAGAASSSRMFAQRHAVISALRVNVSSRQVDGTPDFGDLPCASPSQ